MRELRLPWLWRGLDRVLLVTAFLLLVAPLAPDPLGVDEADKIYHFIGFAGLAAWSALLFEPARPLLRRGLLLAAFGLLTEGIQVLLPWRQGDLVDLAANGAGILLGLSLALLPLAHALSWLERFALGPPDPGG